MFAYVWIDMVWRKGNIWCWSKNWARVIIRDSNVMRLLSRTSCTIASRSNRSICQMPKANTKQYLHNITILGCIFRPAIHFYEFFKYWCQGVYINWALRDWLNRVKTWTWKLFFSYCGVLIGSLEQQTDVINKDFLI